MIKFDSTSIHYDQPYLLQESLTQASQLHDELKSSQTWSNHHVISAPVSDHHPPDTKAVIARASKPLLEDTQTLSNSSNKDPLTWQQPEEELATQLEADEEHGDATEEPSKLVEHSSRSISKEKDIIELPMFYQSYPHK